MQRMPHRRETNVFVFFTALKLKYKHFHNFVCVSSTWQDWSNFFFAKYFVTFFRRHIVCKSTVKQPRVCSWVDFASLLKLRSTCNTGWPTSKISFQSPRYQWPNKRHNVCHRCYRRRWPISLKSGVAAFSTVLLGLCGTVNISVAISFFTPISCARTSFILTEMI